MPLSALGVLTYVAGLLLGFNGHVAVPALVAIAGVLWSVHTQRAIPARSITLLA